MLGVSLSGVRYFVSKSLGEGYASACLLPSAKRRCWHTRLGPRRSLDPMTCVNIPSLSVRRESTRPGTMGWLVRSNALSDSLSLVTQSLGRLDRVRRFGFACHVPFT
jgi:hypothetical protein